MQKIVAVFLLFISTAVFSQDVNTLLKEAANSERSLKDDQAYDQYKQVLSLDATNINALVKSSLLCSAIGGRQTDKNAKANYYNLARDYADKALAADANNADANYARACVAGKLAEAETENKKLVADLKDVKTYAEKALSINPNHGKANYILGKWNFEVLTLPFAKKAAVKVLYGGMPDATIENAYKYMEKCRTLEPYFVLNFLDLAKAYKYDNKPAKAIEVLNQLVKLPTRTPDDVALKAEGKKMLSEMQ